MNKKTSESIMGKWEGEKKQSTLSIQVLLVHSVSPVQVLKERTKETSFFYYFLKRKNRKGFTYSCFIFLYECCVV